MKVRNGVRPDFGTRLRAVTPYELVDLLVPRAEAILALFEVATEVAERQDFDLIGDGADRVAERLRLALLELNNG